MRVSGWDGIALSKTLTLQPDFQIAMNDKIIAPVSTALCSFLDSPSPTGWERLRFFSEGAAGRVARAVDTRSAAGHAILPPSECIFTAFRLTPLAKTKIVILGQDPYPTPGDAHGLAFSYVGHRRLPASLKTILGEMAADLGVPLPKTGDLRHWAAQGVLLLNTALTVEAGNAGAHLKLGWSELADEAVAMVSKERPTVVFMLWGGPARKRAELIDSGKHLILESGHPSPLNRLRDFHGTKPFSKANTWLQARGETPIDWRLP